MDYEQLLKKHRKKPIADVSGLPVSLNLSRQDIKKIIPHREPFLLVDRLIGLDPEEGIIAGTRYIDPDDPVLGGHFPDYPVYPGSLQVEMIGQLGLCLYHFITNNTTEVGEEASPIDVRATRIIGALYAAPLLPETETVIIARKTEYDDFFAAMIGQTIGNGTVCTVAAEEVVFP